MVIELPDGRTYAVHFHYHEVEHKLKYGKAAKIQEARKTDRLKAIVVTVHPGACPKDRVRGKACGATPSMQGQVLLSPLDVFDREKGREEAFKRAIAGSELEQDHTLLGMIWQGWTATKGGLRARFVKFKVSNGKLAVDKIVMNRETKRAVKVPVEGLEAEEVKDGSTTTPNPTAAA